MSDTFNTGSISTDSIPAATTTTKGVVELATDGETTAGLAVQANDSRIGGALGLHSLQFFQSPTSNGTLFLRGWNIQTDAAEALTSAAPVTMSEPAYHSHIIFDVSGATGVPFTVRLTGISIDETDGTTTPADTEDIAVSANGYHQSVKSWIDDVELSIVEGSKSCTVDIYRNTYWDCQNVDFTIEGVRFEWTPDSPAWNIQLIIQKVLTNGSLTNIDNKTFVNTDSPPRAANGKPGKYKRSDYDLAVNGAGSEGIILKIIQNGIGYFSLEMQYGN